MAGAGVTMATTAQVSLDEYLHTVYEPDAEYVDGEVEERAVGKFKHSRWQNAIQKWFGLHDEKWNIWVQPEQRVQVSATRFRVPDVALLDRSLPEEEIVTHPPIAVFEVLSPEDWMQRVLTKLEDYEQMGIRNIFLIDTKNSFVRRFRDRELVEAVSGPLEDSVCTVDWEQIRKYVG